MRLRDLVRGELVRDRGGAALAVPFRGLGGAALAVPLPGLGGAALAIPLLGLGGAALAVLLLGLGCAVLAVPPPGLGGAALAVPLLGGRCAALAVPIRCGLRAELSRCHGDGPSSAVAGHGRVGAGGSFGAGEANPSAVAMLVRLRELKVQREVASVPADVCGRGVALWVEGSRGGGGKFADSEEAMEGCGKGRCQHPAISPGKVVTAP